MREWVTPLHEALAVPLGMSELTDPRRYLHVPQASCPSSGASVYRPKRRRCSSLRKLVGTARSLTLSA
jgi:hypothetical protein